MTSGLTDRSFVFTTSPEAAVDARDLMGARGRRVDIVIDLAAITLGVLLIATGQPVFGCFLVVGAIVFLTLGRRIRIWLFQRVGRSMMGKSTEVVVDDEALRMRSELGTTDVPWSSLTRVRSNERVVIFVRDRLLVGYVPASTFASPEEHAAFVRFASNQVTVRRKGANG